MGPIIDILNLALKFFEVLAKIKNMVKTFYTLHYFQESFLFHRIEKFPALSLDMISGSFLSLSLIFTPPIEYNISQIFLSCSCLLSSFPLLQFYLKLLYSFFYEIGSPCLTSSFSIKNI